MSTEAFPELTDADFDAARFRAALIALQSRLHYTSAKDWTMPGTDATIEVYIANILSGSPVPKA